MKTLIIHPEDDSTNFLNIVYKPILNKTVIKGGTTPIELVNLIQSHDRVMMMGHGYGYGLLSIEQFPETGFSVIDCRTVPLLKIKQNNVFIWCNSDEFVNYHELKGFYTGMFISEVEEANSHGLAGSASQSIVDESNKTFCEIMSRHIKEDTGTLYKNVVKEYSPLAQRNSIAAYNHKRLYAKF